MSSEITSYNHQTFTPYPIYEIQLSLVSLASSYRFSNVKYFYFFVPNAHCAPV